MRTRAIPLLITGFLMISAGKGQTKLIAHKSHSGSIATFETALRYSFFGLGSSNFGAAPTPIVTDSKLDSVIFLSDKRAVMITSNYCTNKRTSKSELWSAGRDTVLDHPLFSKKHRLDSIKGILQQNYFFRNPVENVVFIGFDNKPSPSSFVPDILFGKKNDILSINDRKVRLQADVQLNENPAEILIWDSAEEDGDTVSLYLNGECLLERYKLTKNQLAVKVKLIPNSNNYLVLYAHNVGQKPPNTAAVLVYHRGKPKKMFLKADSKYCGSINFTYSKREKRGDVLPPYERPGPGTPLLLLAAAVFSLLSGYFYSRLHLMLK